MAPTVTMLAECLSLAEAVAEMRWREWGHPPEPEDRTWWLETTIREAGKETLPFSEAECQVEWQAQDSPRGDRFLVHPADSVLAGEPRHASPEGLLSRPGRAAMRAHLTQAVDRRPHVGLVAKP